MDQQQSKHFQDLLLSFSQESNAEARHKIEEGIWQQYGTERAVFVLDMSSFSLLTRRHGIVHYLSMVRRMQIIAQPIIEEHEGSVIKFEADNCFAVFPDTLSAVQAAIALQLAFESANLLTPNELDVYISCGIDYGKILILHNEDYFGDAVNRACKLGEDVATAGEILVTQEAMQRIPTQTDIQFRAMNISISGIQVAAYSVEYRAQ